MTNASSNYYRSELRVIQLDPPAGPEGPLAHMPGVLAEYIRGIYRDHRRRYDDHLKYRNDLPILKYDGGVDRMGVVYTPFWPTLVQHFLRIQVDPFEFIQLHFVIAQRTHSKVPLPHDFLWSQSRETYLRFVDRIQQKLLGQIQYEHMMITCEVEDLEPPLSWEANRAMSQAIEQESRIAIKPFSPVLRFGLAVRYGLQDLAQAFHDSALTQYVFQRSFFDRCEGCHIPECLRIDAAELIEEVQRFEL